MKASKSASLKVAFVLSVESIQWLLEILTRYSTEIAFSVSLSDGSRIYPSSVEELSRVPNIENRKILGIGIQNKWNDKVNVELTFATDASYYSISYSLKGEDQDVLVLDHRVTDWIATIRQKYSWLAFSANTNPLAAIVLFLGLAMTTFPLYFTSRILPTHPYAEAVFVLTGLILQGLVWSSGWLRRRFFPPGMFAIGAGKERIREIDERRKRWGPVSIAMALVIGLADAWLLKLMGS